MGSNFPTSAPIPVNFLDDDDDDDRESHLGGYKMVSYCGFDLHFPND